MKGRVKMRRFILGELESNAYVFPVNKKEAILFDCGGKNLEAVFNFLNENKLTLRAVILSHGHIDHIAGLNILKDKFPEIQIYIGKEEEEFLKKGAYNLSNYIYGSEFNIGEFNNINLVSEGDEIFSFKVLDTPGHTIGGKSYYNSKEKLVITGDTMFKNGGIGRSDFPTGNLQELEKSIKKLCKLPEDTVVFPGHGEKSVIALEKKAHMIF